MPATRIPDAATAGARGLLGRVVLHDHVAVPEVRRDPGDLSALDPREPVALERLPAEAQTGRAQVRAQEHRAVREPDEERVDLRLVAGPERAHRHDDHSRW